MPTPFDALATRCRIAQRSWAEQTLRARLAFLKPLRHLFAEHGERLARTATQDVGRNFAEVLATDVLPSADAFRFLQKRADRVLRSRRVPGRFRPWWLLGERETVHRRPYGIVGVIGTWNYPILLNAVPIAQALVAGNGILWKPSELGPTGAEFLHQLFLDAGVPADLFVRLPATREAGPQLAELDIDHLIFTGSADVGRKLAARLGERLVSSTLELSGCDAAIVLADANVEMAVKAVWYGVNLNRGQTCLAIRRTFVHRSRYAEFVERLRPLAATARPERLELMGQAVQAERLANDALAAGAESLSSASLSANDDPPRFPPTMLAGGSHTLAICNEASFAPISTVIPFDEEAALVSLVEASPFGLAASIFTADVAKAMSLAARLRVGSVSVNDVIVGTAHPAVPFGGVRQSGWGVTRGEEGLLAMTVPQVVTVRPGRFRPHYAGADQPATAEMIAGLLAWYHGGTGRERRAGFWKTLRGMRGTIKFGG